MPAWDNVQLQGPPQAPSYAAPNIGIQLGALLGNLPQDYLGGVETQQKIRQLGLINQILGQQTGAQQTKPGSTAMPGGDIYGAVLGQESGNNDKVADSSAGAIGPGQIMPATFNQYAQPGEDNRDPATNRAVSKRILDDYLQRYNGDVPRALTAYYSGPGNVAPPNSQAPWLADKQPKGGPSVSQYVRQTMGRMDPQARAGGGQVASADPNFVPQQGAQPPQASAESPQQPGAPTTQVAQAGPQGAPQAGASAASALVPQQWRNDPRGYADALGNRANQLRKEADRIESGAKIQAGPIKIEPKAEGLRKAADDADATRSRVLDAIKAEAEPTGAQKEARAAGFASPADLQRQQEQEKAKLAGETEEDKKVRGQLVEYADAGMEARGHSKQLEVIQSLGEKAGYGIIPKFQEYLGRYGIPTEGLSDIQAYKSAVDYMAPQLRPIGSGKLLANELTQFKNALGSLNTTPEGRRISIANLRLISDYKEKIGAIAADSSLGPRERMSQIYSLPPPELKLKVDEAPAAKGGSNAMPTYNSLDEAKKAGHKSGEMVRDQQGNVRRIP